MLGICISDQFDVGYYSLRTHAYDLLSDCQFHYLISSVDGRTFTELPSPIHNLKLTVYIHIVAFNSLFVGQVPLRAIVVIHI